MLKENCLYFLLLLIPRMSCGRPLIALIARRTEFIRGSTCDIVKAMVFVELVLLVVVEVVAKNIIILFHIIYEYIAALAR